jgi:hypothetical protein
MCLQKYVKTAEKRGKLKQIYTSKRYNYRTQSRVENVHYSGY